MSRFVTDGGPRHLEVRLNGQVNAISGDGSLVEKFYDLVSSRLVEAVRPPHMTPLVVVATTEGASPVGWDLLALLPDGVGSARIIFADNSTLTLDTGAAHPRTPGDGAQDMLRHIEDRRGGVAMLALESEPPEFFEPAGLWRALSRLVHMHGGETEDLILGDVDLTRQWTVRAVVPELLDLELTFDDGSRITVSPAPGEADELGSVRREVLSPDAAARTVAAFEAPLEILSALSQEGGLDDWHDDFVRNTIHQIQLWRQRDEANPQIFELLMADMVQKLLDWLSDTSQLRGQLVDLGADEKVADEVAARVSAAIDETSRLGVDDPGADAKAIESIADHARAVSSELENVPGVDSAMRRRAKKLATAAALGAAATVGKEGATVVLHELGALLPDAWSKLQIALMSSWNAVRSWFLRPGP